MMSVSGRRGTPPILALDRGRQPGNTSRLLLSRRTSSASTVTSDGGGGLILNLFPLASVWPL